MDVFLHTIGSAPPSASAKKTPSHEHSETNSPEGVTTAKDSVETSLQLRLLTESVMSAPVVDTARVSRVANAIANGHYQIDPQRTASRMMELEALAP